MNWFTGVVLYVLIWWTALFAVLPIGTRPVEDADEVNDAPMPSLRLIQAPVFHGYSISLWVEFETNPGVSAIEEALEGEPVDLRAGDTEPPNVVGIAGQGGLAIGNVTHDRNNSQAAWLWIVADNLRLRAENAIAVAQELL